MSMFLQAADERVTQVNDPKGAQLKRMRVAIAHHWFISLAGGERVVDAIASIFPTADVFTLFLDERKLPPAIQKRKITTSFLDKAPAARRAHRHLLPFYPLAVDPNAVYRRDLQYFPARVPPGLLPGE